MVWLTIMWMCSPGLAGEGIRAARGEARRLTEEIDRLVEKGVWRGVERAYDSAVSIGVSLEPRVHEAGARSAMKQGDAGLARARLRIAYELAPRPDLLRWLTSFSSHYTRVSLSVDPGAKLQVERRHFDAERALVVDRAAEVLSSTGGFDGLLPMGRYRVGAYWFTIVEDGSDLEADLRACVAAKTCT